MARTFQLLLLTCLACAGGALAAKGADDAGWFGVPSADANLVTTPVGDRLEAPGNDTAIYDDEEYFDVEGDAVDVETSSPKTTLTTAASSSVAPTAKNSSAVTKTTTPRARSTTVSSSAKPPEARKAKAFSSVGKTEEVNYWQTDGLADQPAGGSSRASGSEEARDEPQVSVKEHDRNPHPFAFSASGDNEWFGFGEGDGAPSSGGSKSRLGGSASVAVEDYQTKEQQSGSKDVELETAVEIKEHDELAPGAGGGGFSSSADGGWFGDFGSSNADSSSSKSGSKSGSKSPPPSSDGGGGGGAADDVWFGVEASEWQPVAVSSHRQQRRLNWDEHEAPAESAARDYEALDIITAPPDTGRSRDVYSFVVESSFGGGDRRGRGSGKKDTDGVEDVEIVTAASSADLGWFGDAREQVRKETTTPPPTTTKKVVVKSRTSTTTVRSTVIGRSRTRVGGVVSRNHSFIDLLAKKAGAGGGSIAETVPKVQKPVIQTNGSLALEVDVTALSGASVARNVSLTALQNVTSAPSIDAIEEDNSVNVSPRNQSVITALPTATRSTTTTAAPTTTTTITASAGPVSTKNVPQISTSAPKATASAVNTSAIIDQAATPKPGPFQEPASDVGSAFGEPELKEESKITPSTESSAAKTTAATVLPTRSGRTFVEEAATRPKHSQSSREEAVPSRTVSGDAPANFTSAFAASEPRNVVLRGDANGHVQAGSSAGASDNLSYILVGTCCAVSLVCLAVVVLVVRRRKSLRRRRSSPHPPFQPGQLYAPTSYSYPPSARTGHFAAHPKDGATVAPPDAKARMWFMGRKQSPYSLCDQHLNYCSRDAATDYKQADGGRRHSDGGALANAAPPPPVYRTGFSGLSDARHSSGLDYMNKGEMIYWSSNNEQLI